MNIFNIAHRKKTQDEILRLKGNLAQISLQSPAPLRRVNQK